jgi:hypothetical protein
LKAFLPRSIGVKYRWFFLANQSNLASVRSRMNDKVMNYFIEGG